jgi:predicted RNase H-like HicB family nuclease
MRLKVILHETETSGLWAEVPSLPGCYGRGKNYQELITNLYSAVERTLSMDENMQKKAHNASKIMEVIT